MNFNGTTATTTKDIIVFPGMNTYTVDLGSLTTAPDGGLETTGGAQAWAPGAKPQLRFDPHEFSAPRTFHIDNVKLAAMAETKNSQFVIFPGSGKEEIEHSQARIHPSSSLWSYMDKHVAVKKGH